MPGTLLLDDLRDSVSNQLGDYVNGLTQQATAAVQPIAAAIPTPQAPDPNQILQELQQHAQQAAAAAQQQAQPALQVLGGAQQAAAGAVTQLGQTRDQVQQQLQQHAQDVLGGAQDVGQQLQDHVNTVLGSTTPQAPVGVQSLAKPTPPPVLGAPSGDQNAPPVLGGTTGAVNQPATAAAPGGAPSTPIDSSSPSAFARSIAPYAQYAAQKLGIDPTWVAAMAGSESNYGKAAGNELFGVKALPGQPGTSMQTHEGEYGGTQMNQTFAAYDSPLDAVNAWVDLIQKHYPGAVNAQDLPTFIHGLRQGGYFTAAEDEYLGIVKGISDRIGGDVQAGLQAVGIAPKAPAQVTTAQARAADLGYTDVSQFGDKQLSADEAYAACGPAAAVRFAERFGRNPTLREATDLAKQVGWTSSGGMAGIQSEQKLLSNMGVDTHIVAPDWDAIAKEAQTGNPVTISTPGHYYFADGYNPDTGAFHVGQSGLDLKHGSEWMTPAQMESLMGKAQGALFADNPNVPAKGAAGTPVTLGGGGTQNASITMGANQPAKAPLVVPEDQGPTPIQSAADVVGGAANDALEQARQALQQAQDALGRATQGAQQTVAPILGGAQQTVSAVAQDVQNAAQGVLGQAQDINRQIPTGTAAVNAAAPVLGGVASDIGTAAQQTAQDLGTSGAANALLRQGRTPQEQADFEAQQQQELGKIVQQGQQPAPPLDLSTAAGNVWNLVVNSSPGLPGVSLQDYQHASTVKNDWIEQNNPAKDVLLLGGLTTMIAQQVTDPYALTTFGLTGGIGNVPGEAAGARATAAAADRLGPDAARFVGNVTEKLVNGSIVGGVQNAIYTASQPDATPESVFTALWQGAALGSAAEGAAAAASPIARRIGQTIIDQAPQLRPAVSQFLSSETGAAGSGTRALAAAQAAGGDVLHGQAVPRPGYEVGTPEHTTEQFLQDQARAQGTPNPQLTNADIQSLPGMAGSRMRGLQEVRDATAAGLPAARWYQQIVQQVRQDTGQDINPREAAVLMGATGGNAGVQANYHAMLSIFDAMRQANPDLVGLENMDVPQVMETQAFKDVQSRVRADQAYIDNEMLARIMRGYRTGEVPVPSGAKLSSYTQDFLHGLSESYSPYSTQDVHQGRLFGARPDVQGGKPLPDVSQNDQAYRTMHALTNWVAREMNIPPDQAQAAGWMVFRTLWNDKTIGPELRNDRIGLSDAIKQGQQAGLLDPQTLASGGLAEVTGPRGLGAWGDKINDVRDRIQQNGSYNSPPPASATGLNDIALYHPSIQSAAQQREILDPSGFQYGKVAGPKTGISRPVGNEPAVALRDLALADQPVIRVPGELQVDPTTGRIPWLALEHNVQQTADHAYVTVPGIGDDAAHLIGQRLGADRFNHADPTANAPGGIGVEGMTREEQQRLATALQAQGLPVISEVGGTGLRVPLMEGRIAALFKQVQSTLGRESISGTIGDYEGATHAIKPARSSGVGRVGQQAAAGGSLDIPTRNGVRGQQLAQAVFRDYPGAEVRPGAAAAGGGIRGPELGTTAGAEPPDLSVRTLSQAEARQLVGPAYDPSGRVTREPPPSEELAEERGPVGREPPNVPAGTSIGDIHSNPHLLNEAGAGETPMTLDERSDYGDTLQQRYQANQNRLAAIDEQLRNPNQKPERPPWGAGWTNDQLVTLAKRQGLSAYEPLWWEKAGLMSGSGEVREDVGQSGLARGMGRGGTEPTPTELRAERNQIALDQRDLEAAGEQQATAPDNARFARRTQTTADLPFAGGEENAPHGPYATEQPSSGAGSLAEDIVTQNGRKSYGDPLSGDGLREAPGEVVGTKGGITGTGISDINAEAVRPGAPSAETLRRMPNLDALLKGDMPEVKAQIQRAAEDNPQLFDAYRQGRISHDSLVTDLATKVGMTREQWLKTPIGKGFNQDEMVALQAAAIDGQARSEQMAKDIVARGGVDALSPEQVAYGLNELVNNTRLLSVARGGRSTAGRTLNALKIKLDATMARGITASNDRIAATRLAAQAKRVVARAGQLLEQTRQLETEKNGAVANARANGAPRNIVDRIAEAYDQLDRYQAMTLHEKADDFNALKAQRDAFAAKRQAAVREPTQELLSALQAELKAERDNFAKRKDTWETMAFWDSKANENVVAKRNAFRGGLYIEQARKAADLAQKSAEADAKRAFNLESRRQTLQTQKATTLLEAVGGAKPSRELLNAYVQAVTSDDPLAAGKFVKGLMTPGWWGRVQTLRIAGLLSSTVTHFANMVGNVTQVPLEVATHGMVVGIDWARAKATGGERQAYMGELGPMLEAYGPGFASSMPDAIKILQTGVTPADAANLANIRPGIASGSGKVDAVLEGPLRALQAEDELFRGGAFAMQANRVATRYAIREGFQGAQLKGRAANIIQNLEDYPDLYKEAHDAMLRMVFQEHRDWIPAPRGPVRGVVSQPLPFIKTPANITAQGMGLSPFGLASTIEAVRARGALQAGGTATQAQLGRATLLAEQRLARTALGTAILGMGVGLGAGTFTGGKSMLTGAYDPNEASTYPQGWREWSVVTEDPVSGNTYYVPMQNFGAAGAPLAMAAILTDAGKRGHSLLDQDEAARAATSIGQYVLDNTFLQGLSDTVNVLHDPTRYANKFLESLVSSYGPFSALGRQVQRAYGVASRNPHDGLMGLVEAMESNYPGLSGNVPESLTAIGEPRTQGISGGAAFALPVRADILRDEPTLAALRANDVRIPPPAKAVNVGNGWSVDLTPEEQDQLERARGVAIRDWVARMQAMPAYQKGDLGTRNLYLSKAVSNASQQADVDFYRSLPRSDIRAQADGGRAVRRTVPTPYTVAGEESAA